MGRRQSTCLDFSWVLLFTKIPIFESFRYLLSVTRLMMGMVNLLSWKIYD